MHSRSTEVCFVKYVLLFSPNILDSVLLGTQLKNGMICSFTFN